ncbi:MAG: hypothetical protein RL625_526 [Gemmatimonadota bacterium]
MRRMQPLQQASGRSILALWLLLAFGLAIPLRRSSIFTDRPSSREGWEALLGAPPHIFVPILGLMILVLSLTVRWWSDRSRGRS